jgi:hypothetical protein
MGTMAASFHIVGKYCWVRLRLNIYLRTGTNFANYIKIAFDKNYWSRSHQILVKCSIFQDKYDRQSNLSMSGLFIKYAILASNLEPRLGDGELIDALRSNFPNLCPKGYDGG